MGLTHQSGGHLYALQRLCGLCVVDAGGGSNWEALALMEAERDSLGFYMR